MTHSYFVAKDAQTTVTVVSLITHVLLTINLGVFIIGYHWYFFIALGFLIIIICYSLYLLQCCQRCTCFDPPKIQASNLKSVLKCYIIAPITWFAVYHLLFRFITHKLRKYPDFYILGEQKCGTTTLSRYLTETQLKKYFVAPFSFLIVM